MEALVDLHDYNCLHTRRNGNKMADHLANLAMDTCATTCWSAGTLIDPAIHATLLAHLPGDIASPTSSLRPLPSMESDLRARYSIPTASPPRERDQGAPTAKRLKTG